jgi:hypothetical protein
MTAPKLSALGVVLDIADGFIYVDVTETTEGEALGMLATPDEQAAYRPLVMKGSAIRITIEPADAPEDPPPHGSALDYLSTLKSVLSGLADAHDDQTHEQNSRAIRRCLSLANSASLAILAGQRGGK